MNFSQNPSFFDSSPFEANLYQAYNMNSGSKLPKLPSNNYIDYMTSTIITHTSTACDHEKTIPELKYVFEHLRLENFKTQSCKIKGLHNFKMCPFFHNLGDKRRLANFYSSELCEEKEKCPNGELCKKSHNLVEQLYHPDQYKTKFCSFYPKNIQNCDYGRYCSFAHTESELMIELIHNYIFDEDFFLFIYKTVWCPFSFFQHDKNLCVYAHNFQDFRRKPVNNKYSNMLCQEWNAQQSQSVDNYTEGCQKGSLCEECHGWYEFEFHPLNYKTKGCQQGQTCPVKINCPFFHDLTDKRTISQEMQWNMFHFVPKNRTVSKIFKVIKNENVFFEISNKSSKNFLFHQRSLTNKKNARSSKINRLGSSPHFETNAVPFFNESVPYETHVPSQKSLSHIPNVSENDWLRQKFQKKGSFQKFEESMGPFEDTKDEKVPTSSLRSIVDKENEESLERQFSNMLKNICEEESEDFGSCSNKKDQLTETHFV